MKPWMPFTALLLAGIASAGALDVQTARQFYSRTEYQAAISTLLPANDKNAAGLELLGRAYYMNQQYKLATEWLQKAVDADPSNAGYRDWLGRAYGRRAETASVFTALTYAVKTRENFERAVALDPTDLESLSDLFEFYLQAPRAIGGGVDKAEAIAARIGKLNAAEYESKLAEIAEKRKLPVEAERHYREAARLEPLQTGRSIDLAEFLSRQGRVKESEEILLRAASQAPETARLLFARARVALHGRGDAREAQDLLHRYLASAITPDDPPKSEALALMRLAQGR